MQSAVLLAARLLGRVGCWPPGSEREHIQQLLSASGRVPLYVCAACVNLGYGCRALAAGRTCDEILREYPYLEAEDIAEAFSYAAWRAEEVEVLLRQP
jgi:Protein of unknown function (DUF433)